MHYLLLCVTCFIIYCFMHLDPRDTSALFFKASMCWMSFNLRLHPPSNRASRFVTMNRPGIYVSKQRLIYISLKKKSQTALRFQSSFCSTDLTVDAVLGITSESCSSFAASTNLFSTSTGVAFPSSFHCFKGLA